MGRCDLRIVRRRARREPPGADHGAAGAADYFALLKPRVMSLVLFTALVGLIAAPGYIHPVIAVAALLCVLRGVPVIAQGFQHLRRGEVRA